PAEGCVSSARCPGTRNAKTGARPDWSAARHGPLPEVPVETALQVPPVFWAGFFVFISIMLALDLGVFHRKSEAISVPEAARWTAVWVSLGLLFNGVVWYFFGSEAALTFLTGYVIEY